MQVIKENDGILTNIEVLSLLKSRKESRKQHRDELSKNSATFYSNKIDLQNRTFVENKVSDYIKITKPSKWSLTLMHACLREIKLLQLPITENEFIHIANHLPETDVEFYLLLDNSTQRFSDEQTEQLKEIIGKYSTLNAEEHEEGTTNPME